MEGFLVVLGIIILIIRIALFFNKSSKGDKSYNNKEINEMYERERISRQHNQDEKIVYSNTTESPKKTKKQMEKSFKEWIASIPVKLEILPTLLPNDLCITYDFSLESMNKIESYLINMYSLQEFKKQHELFDCVAAYASKVYMHNVANCKWDFRTDDERNVHFNQPVLEAPYKMKFPPFMNVGAALDRKRGTYISDVITKNNNYIKESMASNNQNVVDIEEKNDLDYCIYIVNAEYYGKKEFGALLEDENKLSIFSVDEKQRLKKQLEYCNFELKQQNESELHYNWKKEKTNIAARLTDNILELCAESSDMDGKFEIMQTASEILSESIVKYDIQKDKWEKI